MNKKASLLMALLCTIVQGAWADDTPYIMCSWDDVNKQVVQRTAYAGNCWNVTSSTRTLNAGLWQVAGSVTIDAKVRCSGEVTLILCDNATLTIKKGLIVNSGNTLKIFCQSYGNAMGKLVATGEDDDAAIGSEDSKDIKAPGTIIIHGGDITATGEGGGAGIGGADFAGAPKLTIFGGKISATSKGGGAGIGSGYFDYDDHGHVDHEPGGGGTITAGKFPNHGNGYVTIYGGDIHATSEGSGAAGIGGGYEGGGFPITIYDGKIEASSNARGPGIGRGKYVQWDPDRTSGSVTIHGGKVTANGGKYGAGIGGGQSASGATVVINGGEVYAYGGVDAAGIGSGEELTTAPNSNGGSLTVNGGYVYAEGKDWGAGIGGGEDSDGAIVKINGGTVIAKAGSDAGGKNGSAIGSEDGDGHRGSLTIAGDMMVHAGQNEDDANNHLFPLETRVPACHFRPYAKIEACNHEGSVWSIDSNDEGGHHTLHCLHCLVRTNGVHNFENGVCTVCGAGIATYNISLYVPSNEKATLYVGYGSESFTIVSGKTFALPEPPKAKEPAGMAFAGWMVIDPANINSLTTYVTDGNETLLPAGSSFTVSAHCHLVARYNYVGISLADNDDNGEVLFENNGEVVHSVVLTGRRLYKDGKWNTICLPFDHTIDIYSPLYDSNNKPDVRALSSTSFENGVLTINFTKVTDDFGLGELTAGIPYLVRWPKDQFYDNSPDEYDLIGVRFENVTISNSLANTSTDYVDFIGTYSPEVIYQEDDEKTELYLGADDKLYYPATEDFTINACRGYFRLKNGLTAGEGTENAVRSFVLDFDFDDDATGISEELRVKNEEIATALWYSLDGRKLSGKPSQKGIYINNGKKRIIK